MKLQIGDIISDEHLSVYFLVIDIIHHSTHKQYVISDMMDEESFYIYDISGFRKVS